MNRSFIVRRIVFVAMAIMAYAFSTSTVSAAETKGSLTYSKGTVALKFAYLVKGPDSFDNTKIIRRLIFTANDIGAKIQACQTMSCVDGAITEGLMVDLVDGSRFNYWMAVNNALTQYSGTQETTALKASADDAKHLAGKLSFDGTTAGGPKVEIDFDASLAKEFSKAR